MLSQLIVTFLITSQHIKGYTDKHGRYVPPHYRSNPNKTKDDNYGHAPNVNPYTGKQGKE